MLFNNSGLILLQCRKLLKILARMKMVRASRNSITSAAMVDLSHSVSHALSDLYLVHRRDSFCLAAEKRETAAAS